MNFKSITRILFRSGKNEYKCIKMVASFFYGFFLGICFYELIIVDLSFTEKMAFICGGIICLMLAIGNAISSQIRCICLLVIPIFAGKVGRGVLKALVIAFIISGPLFNITANGKEVVRVFACTTSLTFNLTKTRFELMFKPFTEAVFGMKTDVAEVKDTLRSVRDLASPITGELEDNSTMQKMKEQNDYLDDIMNDTKRSQELDEKYANLSIGMRTEAKRYELNYLKKIEERCENQFTKAASKCRSIFQNAYDTCYDTVTWAAAWLLCWPMKLDFICNIPQALGGASRCDPSKDMDVGFGKGYEYLKKTQVSLKENFQNVKLQYRLFKFKHLQDFRDASDTAKEVMHEVNRKKELLDYVLIVLKRFLAFVSLRILINAQNYHDKYLRDIEFDNVYVTKYFRKIDARRKVREQKVLFPLKKYERKKILEVWSPQMLKDEKELLWGQCISLSLEIFFTSTFILIDRLFYEALDLVRRHAKIEYTQTGHHDLYLEIKGTGFIASILRSLVKGFNVKKRIKMKRSNELCLPQPKLLSNYYFLKIYGTYFFIMIMMVVEAYSQRLRREICSFFYRKREKKRILYLYNETLRQRRGFLSHIRKKLTRMIRQRRLEEEGNVCVILRIKYPKTFNFLKIFGMARRSCMICEEPEPCKERVGAFIVCETEGCHLFYCIECWQDVGNKCLACSVIEADSSGMEDTEYEDY